MASSGGDVSPGECLTSGMASGGEVYGAWLALGVGATSIEGLAVASGGGSGGNTKRRGGGRGVGGGGGSGVMRGSGKAGSVATLSTERRRKRSVV